MSNNSNNDYPLEGIWTVPNTEAKTEIRFRNGSYYFKHLESNTDFQRRSKRLIKEYIKHYKMVKSR